LYIFRGRFSPYRFRPASWRRFLGRHYPLLNRLVPERAPPGIGRNARAPAPNKPGSPVYHVSLCSASSRTCPLRLLPPDDFVPTHRILGAGNTTFSLWGWESSSVTLRHIYCARYDRPGVIEKWVLMHATATESEGLCESGVRLGPTSGINAQFRALDNAPQCFALALRRPRRRSQL